MSQLSVLLAPPFWCELTCFVIQVFSGLMDVWCSQDECALESALLLLTRVRVASAKPDAASQALADAIRFVCRDNTASLSLAVL